VNFGARRSSDILVGWAGAIVLLRGAYPACHLATSGALYWLWLVGFVLFVVHVGAAFHFKHGWSHAAAFDDTARQTERLIGMPFGGGVYFNYLFLAFWALDLLLGGPRTWRLTDRLSWLRMGLVAYLYFIVFNGTVVFKTGGTRVLGLVLSAALLGFLLVRFLRRLWPRRQGIARLTNDQ
jgi:hypothetical protein